MEFLKLAVAIIFQPIESFRLIKYDRRKYSYSSVFVVLAAIIAVRLLCIYTTHYPVTNLDPRKANILIEIVKMLVPLFTWMIACYATTSIVVGETLFREIMMSTVFSMMPYVFFAFPIALFSHVICFNEIGVYYVLQTALWIWIVILIFANIKTMNDYNAGRAVAVCGISLFTVFLIWGVLLLLYSMTSMLWQFVQSIVREIYFQISY